MIKRKRIVNKALVTTYWFKKCHISGCGRGATPSHVKTRGSGGDDCEYNLTPLCLQHHGEWGQIGWVRFCYKYPEYLVLLEEQGWELDFKNNKMFHAQIFK